MQKQQFAAGKYFSVLIWLLQDRQNFLQEISQNVQVYQKINALLICRSIFFAIYGGIIGASSSWQQALASMVKLPALYLMTLMICLPTLYFFNVFFGSRKPFGQYVALLLSAMAVISVLLFSFAPITLLFMTTTTNNYQFFKLLNVIIFSLTGFLGIKFFYEAMQAFSENELVGQETREKILQLWLILYGLVGCQLGWTLRPFFGNPGMPFELFREMGGNFYLDILRALGEIFGFQ
ncbi:actin-binding WH2 domain-containing protein [Planktothricoides sp. FACHB-1370]|uniref:Actin-binding WH2 domain-containing protein n=2 Tax=Planktothricoides raciborskii TaxID=132608 RepID=A0ABR8EMS6_9CYAN|nr:actin-binding WH2 domain-containing protein [Planktothricoides raciborskii FACHB-1370]MBD2586239.1 actin-binding WH2 domain-containing protein [Planktothricoides raciborskii FACHB-1261]